MADHRDAVGINCVGDAKVDLTSEITVVVAAVVQEHYGVGHGSKATVVANVGCANDVSAGERINAVLRRRGPRESRKHQKPIAAAELRNIRAQISKTRKVKNALGATTNCRTEHREHGIGVSDDQRSADASHRHAQTTFGGVGVRIDIHTRPETIGAIDGDVNSRLNEESVGRDGASRQNRERIQRGRGVKADVRLRVSANQLDFHIITVHRCAARAPAPVGGGGPVGVRRADLRAKGHRHHQQRRDRRDDGRRGFIGRRDRQRIQAFGGIGAVDF